MKNKDLSLKIYEFYKENIDRLNLTDKERELTTRTNACMIRIHDALNDNIYNIPFSKKKFLDIDFSNAQYLDSVLILTGENFEGFSDLDLYIVSDH